MKSKPRENSFADGLILRFMNKIVNVFCIKQLPNICLNVIFVNGVILKIGGLLQTLAIVTVKNQSRFRI